MNVHLELEDKKTWVKGLMIHCPMGESVNDCPANEIRLLPIHERLRLVDQMSEQSLNEIIDHHFKCLAKRENYRFN